MPDLMAKRRLAEQLMAERPTDPEGYAATAGPSGNQQAQDDYVNFWKDLAFSATGIPMMGDGLANVSEGVASGEPWQALGGAAQVGVGAMPGAGLFRAGRAAMAPVFSSAPRLLGFGGAAGTATALPDSVEAKKKSQQAAETKDPYADLRTRVAGNAELELMLNSMIEKQNAARASVKGVNKQSADKIRAEAAAAASAIEQQLISRLNEYDQQQADAARADAPFRERYPGAAELIGGGAAGLATALPFAGVAKKRLAEALIAAPGLNRRSDAFEEAIQGILKSGDSSASAMADAATKREILQRAASQYAGRNSAESKAISQANRIGLSSLMAFEGASVPEQVDALTFAPGHPTREEARRELTRPGYYTERVPAAVLTGVLASGLGTKAADLITPSAPTRPLNRANALLNLSDDAAYDPIRRAVTAANTPPPTPLPSAPAGGPTQPPGGPMGGGPIPPPNPQPLPRQPPQAPPGSQGQGPNTPKPSKNLSSKQADKAKQDIFDAAERKGSIDNVDVSDINIPPRASPATKQKYAEYLDSVKQKAAATGFTPAQMRAAQKAGMKFAAPVGAASTLGLAEILAGQDEY